MRLLVAARDLVLGRAPAPFARPDGEPGEAEQPRGVVIAPRPESSETVPLRDRPDPDVHKPLNDLNWRLPQGISGSGQVVRSLYATGAGAGRVYDVELLERLNAEYQDARLVPSPPSYSDTALAEAARRRVGWVHGMVGLTGLRTLEIGCGNGFEVWSLAHNLGCDAHGVDVTHYRPWDQLAGDRVHFECADLSAGSPYPENSFDRVLSFTVWEHVTRPYAMLQATYDLLRPGGLAWIRANLYAGPQASHRYRDIYFPWPHLLFSDQVVRDWDVKHGRAPIGHAWVNRLSRLHYDQYVRQIGFEVVHRAFTETPIDEAFYTRFEDVLGRYPRADLRRDYLLMVLRKPVA